MPLRTIDTFVSKADPEDIMAANQHIEQMVKKLKQLPPERVVEVEDFIDFLNHRDEDRSLMRAVQAVSERSLRGIWNNSADADYDHL